MSDVTDEAMDRMPQWIYREIVDSVQLHLSELPTDLRIRFRYRGELGQDFLREACQHIPIPHPSYWLK